MARRYLWAGLQLLDRQLVDRDGTLAGNVDDLELEADEKGAWYVTAIHSGPGELSQRLNNRVFGRWLARSHAQTSDDASILRPIPLQRVRDIGSEITLDAVEAELPASATQRWVRDHVISHIPGSRHEVEGEEQ